MAEPLIITTRYAKRADIEAVITTLEDRLKQARADLAHVNATIRLFELRDTDPAHVRAYMSPNRVFARGELRKLCHKALTEAGKPLTTRELTAYVMQSKGWTDDDPTFRKSITFRVLNALRVPRRDRIARVGKDAGAHVWTIAPQ